MRGLSHTVHTSSYLHLNGSSIEMSNIEYKNEIIEFNHD